MTCANHPDRPNTAFCQHCGKPICSECTRTAGTAVFCEPCLAARLNAKPSPIPPIDTGEPSPTLAAILGLIPGVGAMYNGQYAKGLVHLVIFAILVSLAHQVDIFGLFVAGWVFYQMIDAYHTARARRDGTPLPNPFGLNDLGDRLGFTPTAAPGNVPPPTSTPNAPASEPASNSTMPPPEYNYGYQQPPYTYSYQPPPTPALTDEQIAAWQRHRFPAAAVWLIALGILFLLGNLHLFPGNFSREILPILLIGFGIWTFVHRMTAPNLLGDQVDPALRRANTLWACNSGFWLVLIGTLWLLDTTHILRWHYSWPIFCIAGGVMLLVRRAAYTGIPMPPPPPAPPAADPGTAIVPRPYTPDEEN